MSKKIKTLLGVLPIVSQPLSRPVTNIILTYDTSFFKCNNESLVTHYKSTCNCFTFIIMHFLLSLHCEASL